jgi:hypothetical protein
VMGVEGVAGAERGRFGRGGFFHGRPDGI